MTGEAGYFFISTLAIVCLLRNSTEGFCLFGFQFILLFCFANELCKFLTGFDYYGVYRKCILPFCGLFLKSVGWLFHSMEAFQFDVVSCFGFLCF